MSVTAGSKGDWRVLLVMNLVLSATFSWIVVWGLSFLGVVGYSLRNVATLTLALMAVTYLVTH